MYHGLASTCSKKVRLCLYEKGLEWESHLLNLQKFEQHDPAYLELNPKGVVPTLVHDGRPIVESTVIIDYLEEAFPDPPLSPADAPARSRMRYWEKWSDEAGYAAVYVPTWDLLSRPVAEKLDDATLTRVLARIPAGERRGRWRRMARGGFDKAEFEDAYARMTETCVRMETVLADGPWLSGDRYSLADIAIVPFVERMIDLRPDLVGSDLYPRVHDWFDRIRARPAFEKAFFFQGMDARTGVVAAALRRDGSA